METLIFLAIAIVITIIQKKMEKAKKQQNLPRPQEVDDDSDYEQEESEYEEEDGYEETAQEAQPPRSLQDLIRQFEEAQQQATQGNIEPPLPPSEPAKEHPYGNEVTLRDVAEDIITLDVVDLEYIIDEFEIPEGQALMMLRELQKHRVIGHDMGEGEYDVLVHDTIELENLLSHESRRAPALAENIQESNDETEAANDEQKLELERQRELNELEGRARAARESAATISGMDPSEDVNNIAISDTPVSKKRGPQVSVRDREGVRKGFIWAKVLDEPRFKRRWSTQYR